MGEREKLLKYGMEELIKREVLNKMGIRGLLEWRKKIMEG